MSNKKIFYGWFVVICCFFMTFVALGLGNSTKGLYVTPVTESLGIGRGAFTLTFSIREIVKAVTNLAFGLITMKIGYRKAACAGFASLAVSFILFSVSSTLPLFYVAGVFLGVGVTFTSTATVSAIVRSWFISHRGTIMGVIFAGSGLGGSLFSLLVERWILNYGWRSSYRISAIIFALMIIPMALIIRDNPKEKGFLPLGQGQEAKEKKRKTIVWQGLTQKQLVKKPYFWVLVIAAVSFGMLTNPIVVAYPSHLTDIGFDASFSAIVVSVQSLALAAIKIISGYIYDKKGLNVALTVNYAGGIFGCLILAFCASKGMAFAFAGIFSFVLPLETLMIPLVVSDLIGQRTYDHFVGIFLALMAVGIAIGTPLINFYYDMFGSYKQVLLLVAGLSLAVYLMLMWASRQAARLRERELNGEDLSKCSDL